MLGDLKFVLWSVINHQNCVYVTVILHFNQIYLESINDFFKKLKINKSVSLDLDTLF